MKRILSFLLFAFTLTAPAQAVMEPKSLKQLAFNAIPTTLSSIDLTQSPTAYDNYALKILCNKNLCPSLNSRLEFYEQNNFLKTQSFAPPCVTLAGFLYDATFSHLTMLNPNTFFAIQHGANRLDLAGRMVMFYRGIKKWRTIDTDAQASGIAILDPHTIAVINSSNTVKIFTYAQRSDIECIRLARPTIFLAQYGLEDPVYGHRPFPFCSRWNHQTDPETATLNEQSVRVWEDVPGANNYPSNEHPLYKEALRADYSDKTHAIMLDKSTLVTNYDQEPLKIYTFPSSLELALIVKLRAMIAQGISQISMHPEWQEVFEKLAPPLKEEFEHLEIVNEIDYLRDPIFISNAHFLALDFPDVMPTAAYDFDDEGLVLPTLWDDNQDYQPSNSSSSSSMLDPKREQPESREDFEEGAKRRRR
ncbi:hypothetical protein K2X40_00745 [Candidatus Babeliales bacterium]|nr:hypothetical protein [Candidatus Babeliales bacterium]